MQKTLIKKSSFGVYYTKKKMGENFPKMEISKCNFQNVFTMEISKIQMEISNSIHQMIILHTNKCWEFPFHNGNFQWKFPLRFPLFYGFFQISNGNFLL